MIDTCIVPVRHGFDEIADSIRVGACGGMLPPCLGLYRLWAWIVGPAFPELAVGGFADGTISYTLSNTWHDLITSFCIPMHPRPFCTGSGCIAPSSASVQFQYAFWVLFPAATLKHFSTSREWRSIPGIETVPSMMGMLAGMAQWTRLATFNSV